MYAHWPKYGIDIQFNHWLRNYNAHFVLGFKSVTCGIICGKEFTIKAIKKEEFFTMCKIMDGL
jgi:hypothetical protein